MFTWMLFIGLEICGYRLHDMVTPFPSYCMATTDKQKEESKNLKLKNPSGQKYMWKRDNISDCEDL